MAVLIKLAALLCVACAVPGRAQKLYTANGTMYLEMDGAVLALTHSKSSSAVSTSTPPSATAWATQTDVNAALANIVALVQPQIDREHSAMTMLSARLDQTQASLAATAATLTAASTQTASLSTALVHTQASLAVAQQSVAAAALAMPTSINATLASQSATLQAIASCATRGFLADPVVAGRCLVANVTTTTTTTTTSTTTAPTASPTALGACPATNSTLRTFNFPDCQPGFAPESSSTPACPGSGVVFPSTFLCKAVLCPDTSTGINVPSGCGCNAGFSGTVVATTTTPFYNSTCLFTPCPNISTGVSVVLGCKCLAGYNGSITPSTRAPYFESTCTPVACPVNSSGPNVVSGCTCAAGFAGSITTTATAPFSASSCEPVPCPPNSTGTNIVSGCTCRPGHTGTVTPLVGSPFYSGGCFSLPCPPNSAGQGVGTALGCTCSAGFFGTIVATSTPPSFYSGSCISIFLTATAYAYSGTDAIFTVPTTAPQGYAVQALRLKLWGAGGNGGGRCTDAVSGGDGSAGSFVDAIVPVAPGDVITIRVGGTVDYVASTIDGNIFAQNAAQYGSATCSNQGGIGDGGGSNGNSGGTGGGGSSVLRNGVEVARASGGGGGGGCGYGSVRTYSALADESNGAGGAGAGAGGAGNTGAACGGGGGGGSGSSSNAGGGTAGRKGTSIFPANAPTGMATLAPQSVLPGSGTVPRGTADPYYATGVGVGGSGSVAADSTARRGGAGRVVILI